MIEGISHLTLIVKDVIRTAHLFQFLLDAREVYSSDTKQFSLSKEKYLLVAGVWIALMEGEPSVRSYQHIAFKIAEADIPIYRNRISELGLELVEGRKREPQEGASLYFYDEDNHLFELHSGTLESRLAFYSLSELA